MPPAVQVAGKASFLTLFLCGQKVGSTTANAMTVNMLNSMVSIRRMLSNLLLVFMIQCSSY